MKRCLLGMRLAEQIRLPARLRPALFYALLLKDLGCALLEAPAPFHVSE